MKKDKNQWTEHVRRSDEVWRLIKKIRVNIIKDLVQSNESNEIVVFSWDYIQDDVTEFVQVCYTSNSAFWNLKKNLNFKTLHTKLAFQFYAN